MKSLNIFLQAAQGGGGLQTGLFFVLMIGIFYFFMIRPQMKKAKDQKKFMEQVKKGDRIITIGGIHGKITDVNDHTYIIEVEGGNRLKIQRSAISMEATAALDKQA